MNAYRPNGADAQDPVFRDALEQAARDPELGAWFKEQRGFDLMIADKLSGIEPPATLRSAILDGIDNRPSARHFSMRTLLALAAVWVAQLRQFPGIPLAFYNGTQNRHPGNAIDVGDRPVHSYVHLVQTLLHPAHPVAGFGHQRRLIPHQRSKHADGFLRPERAMQQSATM